MDDERILSELGRRYRRNVLALNFVLTVLLAIPDISLGDLRLFGLGLDENSQNRAFYVWIILISLLIYQMFMFYIYARQDRIAWLISKHDSQYSLWYTITSSPFLRCWRHIEPKWRVSRDAQQSGVEIIKFDLFTDHDNGAHGDHSEDVKRTDIDMASIELKHFFVYDMGIPVYWMLGNLGLLYGVRLA